MKGVIRKGLGVAAGLLLVVPTSALAGEASVTNGVARYQAFAGEVNNLSVSEQPGPTASTKRIIYRDTVGVDAGPGCGQLNAFAAECLVPITTSFARAGLGGQNDLMQGSLLDPPSSIGFSVEGDGDDDVLRGTPQRDILDGVGGDDDVSGNAGNDHVEGAGGSDELNGGSGRDVMLGGSGNDNLNADDNAPGDTVDCGEHLFDNDLAIVNLGDLVTNCERVIVVS